VLENSIYYVKKGEIKKSDILCIDYLKYVQIKIFILLFLYLNKTMCYKPH